VANRDLATVWRYPALYNETQLSAECQSNFTFAARPDRADGRANDNGNGMLALKSAPVASATAGGKRTVTKPIV